MTVAGCPPIEMEGVDTVVAEASAAGQPSAGRLFTGPSPLRNNTTVLPRDTGWLADISV